MFFLENEFLKVKISKMGAELQSVYSEKKDTEYIWHGQAGSYRKHAPNLFPFIGNIKNGEVTYSYGDRQITLPMKKHGFAKDMEFELIEISENKLVLELKNSEATKEMYPFNFSFKVSYILKEETLIQSYTIKNLDFHKMPYQVGAHTAFNCQMSPKDYFEDYYLQFQDDLCFTYNMDENNTYLNHIKEFLEFPKKMFLKKENFAHNAYVLDDLKNKKITLRCNNHERGVLVVFDDFPLVTLWSPKDESPFVCIEPWAGTTDFTINSSNAEEKPFINIINPGETQEFTQKFIFF